MYRIVYSWFLISSFIGTRFLGLEKTIKLARSLGRTLPPKEELSTDPSRYYERLLTVCDGLPIAVRCLDQAIVTWFVLNRLGHSAILKIGVSVSPFLSHAWVELDDHIFGELDAMKDMEVVAQYNGWEVSG